MSSAIFLSSMAGVLLAAMIRINATLAAHIGVLESAFVVHVVGTLFAMLFIWSQRKNLSPNNMKSIPPLLFGAGILGVGLVMLSNFLAPQLGMALYVALLTTANLAFGAIADHFGLFGLPVYRLTAHRVGGLVSAAAGTALLMG